MSLPLHTLSSLLAMQDVEDHKPRLSKISWLPDILVFSSSFLPTVLGPWGKEVGLTNNVVPLLSVVVGLLLVLRNSSAYERYAEGRKDFTCLISNARNLSRNIWVVVNLPPSSSLTDSSSSQPVITRQQLTDDKKKLIRLVVAFVVATKHHLRAEGGVHHEDLRGLLPARLAGNHIARLRSALTQQVNQYGDHLTGSSRSMSDARWSSRSHDEESSLGLSHTGAPHSTDKPTNSSDIQDTLPTSTSTPSDFSALSLDHGARHRRPPRTPLKRRPTAVRVVLSDDHMARPQAPASRIGLGRMVELGLPLIIAHEISRSIFRFRRMGCLEAVGPAGMNALQASVAAMTDQLGSMERIVQTPLPYIFCISNKWCRSTSSYCPSHLSIRWDGRWSSSCSGSA
ncbi:hypothetical protein IAR55_002940 [Kwoniella newhampshirensis]|uniref:Uncharacterized protein n=1 Tax=Kwoniella newhampshirensis TaxID=1651941 RepID=A0AAW0Z0C1_9TREE